MDTMKLIGCPNINVFSRSTRAITITMQSYAMALQGQTIICVVYISATLITTFPLAFLASTLSNAC